MGEAARRLHPSMGVSGVEKHDLLKETLRRCEGNARHHVDLPQPWSEVLGALDRVRFDTLAAKDIDRRYEVAPPPPSDERQHFRVEMTNGALARHPVSAPNVSVSPEYWNHRTGFGGCLQPYDQVPVTPPRKSPA